LLNDKYVSIVVLDYYEDESDNNVFVVDFVSHLNIILNDFCGRLEF